MTDLSSNLPFKVAALYRFARLAHYETLQEPLAKLCCRNGIKGTLLLAAEGINGTVAGSARAIAELIDFLGSEPALAGMEIKYSHASEMPFKRMKVRLKKEIVTMGVDDIDPLQSVGTYVPASDWNALIADPDTVLIDTRNDYETAIGTFSGAIDPKTKTFREFPQWVEEHRDELEGKKIAMFCTGGIRCEKATAFVKGLGFDDVFHLKGGILKYLEEVPAAESRWEGECFVFDERVSVGHGLIEGAAELCHACRNPISPDDKRSPLYAEGISCPNCYHERTEEDRARFAERQKQVRLAKERGLKQHIGS
ncbi:rhodanese-related sulfurtransferase [Phyllobacterium sp. 0TCS1.6C]|uniref:oxygen-dependent tRNA uridine(34) hydroxylase TrhO n=1 Tax=unclassified Phyllobacterium TaxID=2638441 RepID=UPI0022653897|nr:MULTISPECIES: rhodanese-related sulfurtransferase [unclassified Phyllobacterium]MCX8280975.1 rhodanese-related sulfurtransferase [Phyllobacterium sp. 0TCS1.6C]MCX8295841.1 rhodanese-related sulfurtransferase [Phyllobacterium sp. 0TCS1.6A]